MNKNKIHKALKEIAERDGVSITYVRTEIQKAIDLGFDNPDPNVQAEWKKIPYRGKRPTPEEVIVYEVKKVKKFGY